MIYRVTTEDTEFLNKKLRELSTTFSDPLWPAQKIAPNAQHLVVMSANTTRRIFMLRGEPQLMTTLW